MKKGIIIILALFATVYFINKSVKKLNLNSEFEVGQSIDSFNNVIVYYNGGVGNVVERNTKDGYNIGLKYQCVEFVKRYYFEYFNHKMPDSYGHAKSFYDPKVKDGQINKQRDLLQFKNPSKFKPQESDLIIMDGTMSNKYGHVAIISKVTDKFIELIQQNPGPFSPSRITIEISETKDGNWKIEKDRVLGWLRKK